MRRLATLLALVAASAALSAGAAPAGAASRMEIAVQDDPVFVQLDYYDRERALVQARRLGVTRIRANLVWATLNGAQARGQTPPARPAYDWSRHDALIDAAARHGIRVQLTITGPAPAWATSNRRVGVFGPRADAFGEFARAAALHFRGRADRYSIWNEPNLAAWIQPFDLSAAIYRELFRAAYTQIKRVDRRAQVLIGETNPYAIRERSIAPLQWLRDVTCTTPVGRRSAGRQRGAARLRRAPCTRLVADGYAHHPYDYRHRPDYRWPGVDNATLGSLDRMRSTLAGLARVRALTNPRGRALDLYLTEYGYFAPTGRYPAGEDARRTYLPRAYAIAQRTPGVRQMLQYTLVTPPAGYPGDFFDMSLVTLAGEELAPYRSLARWVRSAGRRRGVVLPRGPIALPPPGP
jgi:hypothetical protein